MNNIEKAIEDQLSELMRIYLPDRSEGFISQVVEQILALVDIALLTEGQCIREGLYEFIKHGDDKHKAWLKEAINCYFDGRPRPPSDAKD